LSKYEKGKIALRWRIEKEVFDGKGELVSRSVYIAFALGLAFEVEVHVVFY